MKTFLHYFVKKGEGIWAQSSGEYCQFQTLFLVLVFARPTLYSLDCTGSLLCSVVVLNAEFSLPWQIALTTPCLVYNDSCCWSRKEKIQLGFTYNNCGRLVWSVINDVNIRRKLKRKLMCACTPIPPNWRMQKRYPHPIFLVSSFREKDIQKTVYLRSVHREGKG